MSNKNQDSVCEKNLGEYLWYKGNFQRAKESIEKGRNIEENYIPFHKDNATTCEILAKVLIDMNKIAEAEKEITKGLAHNTPQKSQRVCLLGLKIRVSIMKNDYNEAQRAIKRGMYYLKKYTKSKYDTIWFFLYKAKYHIKTGRFKSARKTLNSVIDALKERNNYPKTLYYYLSALIYEKEGDTEKMQEEKKLCADILNNTGINPKWAV